MLSNSYGFQNMLKDGYRHYQGLEEALYRNIEACKAIIDYTAEVEKIVPEATVCKAEIKLLEEKIEKLLSLCLSYMPNSIADLANL